MSIGAWIILSVIVLLTVWLVFGAVKLERKATEWEWLHPPEEEEDGVFILKEDDPDGKNPS